MDARYLTVDLIIKADSDLTALTEFLEDKVFFLWKEISSSQSSLGFETNLVNTTSPEEDISEFLNVLASMPSDLLGLLTNSKEKIMDIGYECGAMVQPLNSFISSKSLQKMAQLGFAINIRLYPGVEHPSKAGVVEETS